MDNTTPVVRRNRHTQHRAATTTTATGPRTPRSQVLHARQYRKFFFLTITTKYSRCRDDQAATYQRVHPSPSHNDDECHTPPAPTFTVSVPPSWSCAPPLALRPRTGTRGYTDSSTCQSTRTPNEGTGKLRVRVYRAIVVTSILSCTHHPSACRHAPSSICAFILQVRDPIVLVLSCQCFYRAFCRYAVRAVVQSNGFSVYSTVSMSLCEVLMGLVYYASSRGSTTHVKRKPPPDRRIH
ncbi:hypothetical protein PAXRUDRAFT_794465 [Paxillus rubicundulus Ve08.2h10]|uniref:Uncharacterized protein n=1 Tax=Paxillus rubicundulus Ve08.2h10 TaxID=930991 RepID=A0A0D0DVS0_9AGAM|nr:hypothetical protein PAXRUDRAFT_794465 [Paxillus rubicundulus Ve08.2h10]